jgi:hypothetical protein
VPLVLFLTWLRKFVDRGGAVALACGDVGRGKGIGDAAAADHEYNAECCQGADGDPGLSAELAPGEPDHRVVSNAGRGDVAARDM